MKINTTKSRSRKDKRTKKTVLLVLGIIIFLALAYSVTSYALKIWPFSDQVTESQSTTDNDTETTPVDTETAPESDKGESSTTTDQIPVDTTAVATISTLYQADGYVYFKADVTNAAAGGKCSVIFSNSNSRPVVIESFDPVTSGTGITCSPAELSEQEFSYLGSWTAVFRYYINNTQVTAERSITIQ